jgi:Phosphotransferase system, mannose/fructose-specific component IIA
MSVGILLVTHGKLGHLLLHTVRDLIGNPPLRVEVLEVRRVQATEVLLRQGERMLERLDEGDGVLMLTDTFGSTPSNIAVRLGERPRTALVAGLNLPMLMRTFNYPACDLDAMADNAVEGGRRGVLRHPCPTSERPE